MQKIALYVLPVFLMASFHPVQAATLDDDSIRALYAEEVNVIRDPQKSHVFWETHLDDNGAFKLNVISQIPNVPTQPTTQTMTKAEQIASDDEGYKHAVIDTFTIDVQKIDTAADHSHANVTYVMNSTGTMVLPLGQKPVPMNYVTKLTCVDEITPVAGTLKQTKSECTENIALTPTGK